MRASVGARGAAGSTFDHVAREAGVSRGLLHYYFGTKERLLVEVVPPRLRHPHGDARRGQSRRAADADELIDAMVHSLEEMLERGPRLHRADLRAVHLARATTTRSAPSWPSCCAARASTSREQLERKADEGAIRLAAPRRRRSPRVLFALADGLALRMISEPDRDHRPAIEAATVAVRNLFH